MAFDLASLASAALSDRSAAIVMEVQVDEAMVCPLLKGGPDGGLPPPKPGDFWCGVDLRSRVAVASIPPLRDGDENELRKQWRNGRQSDALLGVLQNVNVKGQSAGGKPDVFFLDADRRALVHDIAGLVAALDSGNLEGNCNGRLIPGPKGCGKSSILQALAVAVQRIAKHTIAVCCDVSAAHKGGFHSPGHVIQEALLRLLPKGSTLLPEFVTAVTHYRIKEVLDGLAKLGLRIFLVLDEFPAVYALPEPEGSKWITQVYAMGQRTTSPATHVCVVSGSASYFRSTAFGKLPVDPATYPSYSGRCCNLNPEKFTVRVLGPISDRAEFLRFFAETRASGKVQRLSAAQLDAAFVATGGIHRRIDHVKGLVRQRRALPKDDTFFTIADLISKYHLLLGAMLGRLREKHEEAATRGSLLRKPWLVVEWIPWTELHADVGNMPQAHRYTAADDGAVIYEQAEAGDRVRFVSPLHAIVLHERSAAGKGWPEWFDARARAALRFPHGILRIEAEDIMRRCMMETGWQPSGAADDATGGGAGAGPAAAAAVPISTAGAGTSSVAAKWVKGAAAEFVDAKLFIRRPKGRPVTALHFHASPTEKREVNKDADLPCDVPMAEHPDVCGADIVCFRKRTAPPGARMARMQVKLGTSTLGKTAARAAIQKLQRGKDSVSAALEGWCEINLFLLTTRRCTADAIDACKAAGVTLLAAADLAQCWAPCVHEWAAAEKLSQYDISLEEVGGTAAWGGAEDPEASDDESDAETDAENEGDSESDAGSDAD